MHAGHKDVQSSLADSIYALGVLARGGYLPPVGTIAGAGKVKTDAATVAGALGTAAAGNCAPELILSAEHGALCGAVAAEAPKVGGMAVDAGTIEAVLSSMESQSQANAPKIDRLVAGSGKLIVGIEAMIAGFDRPLGHAQGTGITVGIGALADGLTAATAGVIKADGGASELAAGQGALKKGLGDLAGGAGQVSGGAAGLADGLVQLDEGASKLAAGAGEASKGSKELVGGINQLADGGRKLSDGSKSAASGAGELATGLGKLNDGSRKLADGAYKLSDGLAGAATGSLTIADGLQMAKLGNTNLVSGATQLSEKGTSVLANEVNDATIEQARKVATLRAASERAKAEGLPYPAADGALATGVYKLELASAEGATSDTTTRLALALLVLAAMGAGAAFTRKTARVIAG